MSTMSVVAEGWTAPARRKLCQRVEISRPEQLVQGVPKWARLGMKRLDINFRHWAPMDPKQAASTVFRMLQNVPNLRRLRLDALPFQSFHDADSRIARTVRLLPRLSDLHISRDTFPRSFIFDLLATSGQGISRLSVGSDIDDGIASPGQRLDFGGNLRYLSVPGKATLCAMLHLSTLINSLAGLEELYLGGGTETATSEQIQPAFHAIAPTLKKLTVPSPSPVLGDHLPLLVHLSELKFGDMGTTPNDSIRRLPPSISSIYVVSDLHLRPLLLRWIKEPALIPRNLKRIHIRIMFDTDILQQLPPLERLSTVLGDEMVKYLKGQPLVAPSFKILEMYLSQYSENFAMVDRECRRLGVELCPISWDK